MSKPPVRRHRRLGLASLLALALASPLPAASYSAFERLVVVTASADVLANGQTLRDALAFAEAAGPTEGEPWTLRLTPGIYDVGSSRLDMVSFVDIEGSGEGTTKITAHTDGFGPDLGAVFGADHAELRFLTVENQASGTAGSVSRAIRNGNVSPTLSHVTAVARGGQMNNQGVVNGNTSKTLMRSVTAIGSGGQIAEGVVNGTDTQVVMLRVTARATGGSVQNWAVINTLSADPIIRDSVLEAIGTGAAAIINQDTSTVRVANSQLTGGVTGGGFTCVGAYDGSFSALDTGCL